MSNSTEYYEASPTDVLSVPATAFIYPRGVQAFSVDKQCANSLAELPNGLLFNRNGVEAFNRARQEAIAGGLDIEVVSALRSDPQMPLYPFRGRRAAPNAHHSTHYLDRGAIGIDIAKWWQVKDILERNGFRWRNHPDHPGHFDFVGSHFEG